MSDSETPRGRWPALTVASAGHFFVLLDVTIANVALAKISGGFGGSRTELQWVVDAYALVLAATMLSAGDLADRLGSPDPARCRWLSSWVLLGRRSTDGRSCHAQTGYLVKVTKGADDEDFSCRCSRSDGQAAGAAVD